MWLLHVGVKIRICMVVAEIVSDLQTRSNSVLNTLSRYPFPSHNSTVNAIIHPNQRYLLLRAWLIELILLAIPPPARILLASASSNALCVTEASSKSLKLLPMLGLPSLPSLPFLPGLLPASSAVLFGLNGPGPAAALLLTAGLAELALESLV
jgi:hypothetical protein